MLVNIKSNLITEFAICYLLCFACVSLHVSRIKARMVNEAGELVDGEGTVLENQEKRLPVVYSDDIERNGTSMQTNLR